MITVQRLKSKMYLDWVRTLPCVITGQLGVHAHHLIGHGQGGMGLKASDYFVIPLSPMIHEQLHKQGWRVWEEQYGTQWSYVAQTMHKAIEEGVL